MASNETAMLHKKLYRIYYTTYSDEINNKVIEALKSKYGAEPIYFRSSVLPEFRYLELRIDKPGLEREIASLVSSIVGSNYVKVDWINTEV